LAIARCFSIAASGDFSKALKHLFYGRGKYLFYGRNGSA